MIYLLSKIVFFTIITSSGKSNIKPINKQINVSLYAVVKLAFVRRGLLHSASIISQNIYIFFTLHHQPNTYFINLCIDGDPN